MKLKITRQEEDKRIYGHGKLLITSEYFVLDSALALALPTRFGQLMRIRELHASENLLYWVALNSKKQAWLNLVFDTTNFECINSNSEEAKRLSLILQETRKLNPTFLSNAKDRAVETQLEFPNEWGLGSSSTLIYCLARWAEVDSYTLLKHTIGGSGYDVACAGIESPILYQLDKEKPTVIPVHWKPDFSGNIFFAFTGKKQLSSEGIKSYRENTEDKTPIVNQLTKITEQILKCSKLTVFEELLTEHELIVGRSLNRMKAKDLFFEDYWGSVKSLGAWGGDFLLFTNDRSKEELKNYLLSKNISTVFGWEEIIL